MNHYCERLGGWNAEQGLVAAADAPPAAESLRELDNLTTDPEERRNVAADERDSCRSMEGLLLDQRQEKRRLPQHRHPLPPRS